MRWASGRSESPLLQKLLTEKNSGDAMWCIPLSSRWSKLENYADISGKTAFVTGGASGLGLGMARALANRGASVMLADINEAGVLAAAETLRAETNAEIDCLVCDVAREQAMRAAVDKTIQRFGKVHIVVNNAGVGLGGETGDIPLQDWRWVVDINLMGVVYGVEMFVPHIKAHGEGGHIINTASMAGHVAGPGMAPYNATKFAVVGYSEALAQELAPHKIGVSCLCPGWVNTNIHESGLGRPSGGVTREAMQQDERYKEVAAVIAAGLDPDAVGDWVADCVEANRLHVFTHGEMKPFVDARAEMVAADYQAIVDDGRFS